VLDLHLPDMGGAEIVSQLLQDPTTAEIPIVITTGGAAAGELERLLAAGVCGYLEKPLDFGRLREVVSSFRT